MTDSCADGRRVAIPQAMCEVGGPEVVNTIGLVHTETIEGTRPCLLVATHSAVLGDGYAGSASGEVG
jgi:hypothetical protein